VADGIEKRHRRGKDACATIADRGARCNCRASYRAVAWSNREGRKVARTFATLAEARLWRSSTVDGLATGKLRAVASPTVREAAERFLADADAGIARGRGGTPYKPSVLRGYRAALDARILPMLGGAKLADVRRRDVQRLVDEWLSAGASPSTVRNALMPLRVVYRRARRDGIVAVSPVADIDLPADHGKRDRIATPDEAERLLAVLAPRDRALWACALYAGLRRGELMALRWSDVELANGRIRVEWGWDERVGKIEPKSKAAVRTVPIVTALRDAITEHKLSAEWEGDGLVFGVAHDRAFAPSAVRRRALTAWRRTFECGCRSDAEKPPKVCPEHEAPSLAPIGLHECRHTFASVCIAAGVNAKALSEYLGHGSIALTFDRYGHLMPGNANEAVSLVDAYLSRGRGGETVGKRDTESTGFGRF
jgi:integrase